MTDQHIIVDKSSRQINLVNSTVLFASAFLLLYIINILIVYLFAEYFGIDAKIHYYGVEYLISNHSSKWTVDSLILMFLAGPFVSLMIAGISARLHGVFRADKGHLKLFFLFVYLNGMNFCFGSILAGSISKKMTWYAMAWMGLPGIIMFMLGIIGIILLWVTGSAKAIFFLESCNYPNPNHPTNRQYWLLNTILKPWFLSSLIIILFLLPNIQLYFLILLISPIFTIMPIFRNATTVTEVMVFDADTSVKVFWKTWALFIVVALLLRFFLL